MKFCHALREAASPPGVRGRRASVWPPRAGSPHTGTRTGRLPRSATRMQTTPKPEYQRLTAHLAARTARTTTLTFEEVERLIAGALPVGAYERRDWWAHTGYARHWRGAGWRVESADVLGRVVTLIRSAP